MSKKISFLVVALFATVLMGCDQGKKDESAMQPSVEQPAGGKIENAETGALTPNQEATPSEEAKKAE